MPKYKIGRSYGYVGTSEEDYIEADNLEQAEREAWEFALEKVESWAVEVEEEGH